MHSFRKILTSCTTGVSVISLSTKENLLTYDSVPKNLWCQPQYALDNHAIPLKESHRDLGVIISSDLSWSEQYTFIISKSYKTLHLIRRTFGFTTSIDTRKKLYLSLVRSKLTYCSSLWRPHLIKDIRILESVQRRATKWILNDYSSTYKQRLTALNLLPLMIDV